ncbi:hypothetical protein GHT06_010469 [Daphnia sinensis]|uniref:Transmembrane protein 186 n=1 Tax=Daphnia sinensis TaxID=1820382 RepID=A0AAD5PXH7_9CRUS|nr:hypothetical protein GHT06_010469 [Daphnia sinensis]
MLVSRVNSLLARVHRTARNQNLFRSVTHTAQRYTSKPTTRTSEELINFKPVYKLPYIVHARVLCKLKLYQTAVVLCLTGASVATQAELFIPLTICTVSLTMLGIMGEFFRKLIGIMYVNPTTDEVKIAHLNFWGNRKEMIRPINDIVPPSDIGENISDAFVKFTFVEKSTPNLYLSVKYGHILDKHLFQRVVGEL